MGADDFFIPEIKFGNIKKVLMIREKSDLPARYGVASVLREVCLEHNQKLLRLKKAPLYLPERSDLEMYLMGCDAPLSLIVLSLFVGHPRFNAMLDKLRLPHLEGTSLAKKSDRYDTQIYCRVFITHDHFKRNGQSSALNSLFEDLCERPFFPNEPYFVAGVEMGKILFMTLSESIVKETEKQHKAGSPPAFFFSQN